VDAKVQPKRPGDPRRLGPYELVGRLGEGGMGVVFLGRERRGGNLAAVKALRPELAGDPAFAARFRREVEAARRVESRHVARVLHADPAADRPWLATEHVDGATLAAEVAGRGPLVGEELVAFCAGVAEALAAIHAAGVVHRDLKPANVLLQHDPAAPDRPGVKVIDFGIARAADATRTRSGLRFGTPSWMAPEQLRDQPAGPPADVFAWALLAAFAATGRHPFGGGPADAVAYRILHDRPDLDGVPEPVRHLVRSALDRDPAARPTAARLAASLAGLASPTLPLPATGPTLVLPAPAVAAPVAAAGRPRRRRAGRLLAAAALLVGLAATPQVVLAAVGGPDDPAAATDHRHTAKRCADDDEDEEEEEARERHRDDDEDDEARASDGEGPGDRADPAPPPDPVPTPDGDPGPAPSAGERPSPPATRPSGGAGPAPGGEVLGS
jgi:eukaryotic-like serine/threonine-protein kinase